MKEVKKYICEICHTEYSDKSACTRCEKGHVTAREIAKERHLSISQNGKGYPVSITVKMSDGTEKVYKRG